LLEPPGVVLCTTPVLSDMRAFMSSSYTVNCWFRFRFAFCIFMVALWNRADHYIFMLFLSSSSFFFLFSSPNLSGRRLDVYHTLTHGVALVRI